MLVFGITLLLFKYNDSYNTHAHYLTHPASKQANYTVQNAFQFLMSWTHHHRRRRRRCSVWNLYRTVNKRLCCSLIRINWMVCAWNYLKKYTNAHTPLCIEAHVSICTAHTARAMKRTTWRWMKRKTRRNWTFANAIRVRYMGAWQSISLIFAEYYTRYSLMKSCGLHFKWLCVGNTSISAALQPLWNAIHVAVSLCRISKQSDWWWLWIVLHRTAHICDVYNKHPQHTHSSSAWHTYANMKGI